MVHQSEDVLAELGDADLVGGIRHPVRPVRPEGGAATRAREPRQEDGLDAAEQQDQQEHDRDGSLRGQITQHRGGCFKGKLVRRVQELSR